MSIKESNTRSSPSVTMMVVMLPLVLMTKQVDRFVSQIASDYGKSLSKGRSLVIENTIPMSYLVV